MYPVVLSGERIGWRELTVDDAEFICELVAHPLVFRTVLGDEPPRPDQAREVLGRPPAADGERSEYQLGMDLGGRLVGCGGLTLRGGSPGCAEIGYMLHPDHWGRGLATEAAALLLCLGFDHLGLHRIEATTAPDNVASQRVLDKIGMWREGLRRQDQRVRGRWRDTVCFAVLDTDPRPRPRLGPA